MFEDPARATTTERRSKQRQGSSLTTIRYVVVLGMGTVCRAELMDETPIGIGFSLNRIDNSALVGDMIEIIYRGERQAAEIRHITKSAQGYHVGVHWKNGSR
jgi:hypothetical protein